jgi:hypothetical protein
LIPLRISYGNGRLHGPTLEWTKLEFTSKFPLDSDPQDYGPLFHWILVHRSNGLLTVHGWPTNPMAHQSTGSMAHWPTNGPPIHRSTVGPPIHWSTDAPRMVHFSNGPLAHWSTDDPLMAQWPNGPLVHWTEFESLRSPPPIEPTPPTKAISPQNQSGITPFKSIGSKRMKARPKALDARNLLASELSHQTQY